MSVAERARGVASTLADSMLVDDLYADEAASIIEQALLAERRLTWKQAEEMVLAMTKATEAPDRVVRHVQAECPRCQSFVAAADVLRAAAEKE